jgi:hypothetical protein
LSAPFRPRSSRPDIVASSKPSTARGLPTTKEHVRSLPADPPTRVCTQNCLSGSPRGGLGQRLPDWSRHRLSDRDRAAAAALSGEATGTFWMRQRPAAR